MSFRLNRSAAVIGVSLVLQFCQTINTDFTVQAATLPKAGEVFCAVWGTSAASSTLKISAGRSWAPKDSVPKDSVLKDPVEDKPAVKPTATGVTGVTGAGSDTPSLPEIGMKHPLPVVNLVPVVLMPESIFSMPEWTLAEEKTFEATAYALKGRTRTGVYVRRGVIAADPSVLPLGSVVQLSAGRYSGVYTVHDTGGRIKGEIIDVWMPSKKEARLFGRQNVRVQVLKMGKTRLLK